jgi:hypothetical protein
LPARRRCFGFAKTFAAKRLNKMKNGFLAIVSLAAISTIALADGKIPFGGRTRPQNQTCFTDFKSTASVPEKL